MRISYIQICSVYILYRNIVYCTNCTNIYNKVHRKGATQLHFKLNASRPNRNNKAETRFALFAYYTILWYVT